MTVDCCNFPRLFILCTKYIFYFVHYNSIFVSLKHQNCKNKNCVKKNCIICVNIGGRTRCRYLQDWFNDSGIYSSHGITSKHKLVKCIIYFFLQNLVDLFLLNPVLYWKFICLKAFSSKSHKADDYIRMIQARLDQVNLIY